MNLNLLQGDDAEDDVVKRNDDLEKTEEVIKETNDQTTLVQSEGIQKNLSDIDLLSIVAPVVPSQPCTGRLKRL